METEWAETSVCKIINKMKFEFDGNSQTPTLYNLTLTLNNKLQVMVKL